ncbi:MULTISPECIES: ArsR/SmtB family transcription factor [unclassified Isoptericola]|uniref:ArsR/SmtB family transcription factor n=1 Tax=Isoptericola sp. NPDC057191 TaxID=3346041 RepID=UPI0036333151
MPTDIFGALANPVRRRLLDALRAGPESTSRLAAMFELGRPAVSEHLAVLRDVGLVREERRGRHRFYHLRADGLAEVDTWLRPFEHYWTQRLDALADLADLLDEETSRDD